MEIAETARHARPWWGLVLQAMGGPRAMGGKAARLGQGLASYAQGGAIDERLERLRARGVIEEIPTRLQLVIGAIDMLRFWIVPAARDYYERQGLSFGFHQLLRFLDEPLSLTDPVGLLSERDAIIGHVMQVVHANPAYDLQLLEMFEDGLAEMEAQVEQMLAGTHPRAASIGAIVEDPTYHARLLEHVRAWRRDPASAPPLVRENVAESERFRGVERIFGTMTGAFRYFAGLPRSVGGAVAHVALADAPHRGEAHGRPRTSHPNDEERPWAPPIS